MKIIPLDSVPSQTLNVVLENQSCVIKLYQKRTGMYIDLNVDGVQVCYGGLSLNGYPLIKNTYHGFVGNLMFVDQVGTDAPDYTGLGSSFLLYYITSGDL